VPTPGGSASAKPEEPQQLKDLKEGKLFQYGLTGGVAFAVHSGMLTKDFTGTDSGAMPYVAFFPVQAWFNASGSIGEETNQYCAATWLGGDSESAAKTVRDNAAARLRRQGIVTDTDTTDTINKKILKHREWDVAKLGRCPISRYIIGFYLGLPTGDISASADSTEQKTKATVSYGIAIAPISYVTILIGRTHLHYALDKGDRVERQVLTLGLGGTLDIANLLIPSK
jgi:hypothetical protein